MDENKYGRFSPHLTPHLMALYLPHLIRDASAVVPTNLFIFVTKSLYS